MKTTKLSDIDITFESIPRHLPVVDDISGKAHLERFKQAFALLGEYRLEKYGDAFMYSAEEIIQSLSETVRNCYALAYAPGVEQPIGVAYLMNSTSNSPDFADVSVYVQPKWRRIGIGRLLFNQIMQGVKEWKLRILTAYVAHPEKDVEDRVSPKTAPGSVPFDDAAGFILALGGDLKQVIYCSELDITKRDSLRASLAGMLETNDAEYEILTYSRSETIPEKYFAGYATCLNRMFTDAPQGDTSGYSTNHTADSVRDFFSRLQKSGRGIWVGLAVTKDSDEIIGFCTLSTPNQAGSVMQDDLLVFTEHRGKHLGSRLKAAMYQKVLDDDPDCNYTCIRTWNAVENEPVLGLNRKLGFQRKLSNGSWEIALDNAGF